MLPTHIELCVCTSDREHSTHTSEGSAGHRWRLRLILLLVSM